LSITVRWSFASAVPSNTLKIDFNITKFTLKNGLTVLLHEDHTVPLIAYHTWYRVGSKDESPGVTGAAHMLEHMMFKGSKKFSGSDFDRILHENGMTNNAFTTSDFTGFYETLPSSKLELMMEIEVDRMRNLSLKAEDLTSELQVVGEERRWRVDNNPTGLLSETFHDLIYKVHPYRWPVIGYMADIQAYTVEKLKKFYDQYYIPNNAVLVLVGDFETENARKLVEKYYSSLQGHPLPVRAYPKEPPIKSKRFRSIHGEVQSESFTLGFAGVPAGHKDAYALDLLANVLGQGKSSPLYQKLVREKQTAMNVSAYNYTGQESGSFTTSIMMKPNVKWAGAAEIARQEIQKYRTHQVTERELRKAKNQVMKDFVEGLSTIDDKAQVLAINEIYFNDYKKMFSDLEAYENVKAKELQIVAQKYLILDKEVSVLLQPNIKKGKQN
jgi:zinc protease